MNDLLAAIAIVFLNEEMKALFVKILVPAFVTISVRLAVLVNKQKMTLTKVIASYVIGMGSAFLLGDWILQNFSADTQRWMIALVAISGDKIGLYLIETLTAKNVLTTLWEFLSFLLKSRK
jgi:hypothetical protein